MVVKPASETKHAGSVEYWKARYERQKFLISSMAALLTRYGSSIEPDQLYSVFLLTLMGQYAWETRVITRTNPRRSLWALRGCGATFTVFLPVETGYGL